MPARLNTVPAQQADLYAGEDTPIILTVDASLDASGIPVEDWTVELRVWSGTVPDQPNIVAPDLTVAMSYNSPSTGVDTFVCTVSAHDAKEYFIPGRVTLEIWRTNNSAKNLLERVDCRAWATEQPVTP